MRSNILVCACFALVCGVAQQSLADPVIAALDSTRHGSAALGDGSLVEDARASLFANFPSTSIVTGPTWSSSLLNGANLAVVHNGYGDSDVITPLTMAEQTALYNFVLGGGNALVLGDGFDPPSANNVVNIFGATIAGRENGISVSTVTSPAANVLTDGPFGQVNFFPHYYTGWFTGLPPSATTLATLNENGLPTLVVIEAGAFGPTSGRVVLMSDASPFVDDDDNGGFAYSEALFLNSIDYLAVPEPSTGYLFATASVGVLFLMRHRFSRSRNAHRLSRA